MIKRVNLEYINEIIENRNEHIGERVYSYDEKAKVFIACDNSTSDAWVEEFKTEKEAITWLNEEN